MAVPYAARTTYYPSLAINLQLRFDEGKQALKAGDPKSAQSVAEAGGNKAPAVQEPVILQKGRADDSLSQVLGIVPKSCSVELPGYRQAGTFSFDIEFKDLPIDPRIIRAMGVAIHLGVVDFTDFAEGITQVPVKKGQTQTKRKSILTPTASNLVLAGTADSINVEHSSRGSWVHVEGRDLRGILLDAHVAPETLQQLNMELTILEIIETLVDKLSVPGAGVEVEIDPDEWPNKEIPSPMAKGVVTRSNLNAKGQKTVSNTVGDATKATYWDLITQWCFHVGAVPYFVGSKLRIRPARNLYYWTQGELNPSAKFPTPFALGQKRKLSSPTVTKNEQLAYRRLVYGQNIEQLKFERKLGGVKVPAVLCVSTDTSSTEGGQAMRITAQWPPEEEKQALTTNVGASGEAPATEFIIQEIPGIADKDRLLEIAKNLYEEVGRQELGGSVQTKNLASFGGDNTDPDMLSIRPGDPVEFRIQGIDARMAESGSPINELLEWEGRPFEDEVKVVTARLGNEKLARALVEFNRGKILELQKTFRVSNVKYDWDVDSGVSIAFDFQNFVEIRYGITKKAG